MLKTIYSLISAAILLLITPMLALAQTDGVIDLTGITGSILQILGIAIATLVAWGLTWVIRKTKLDVEINKQGVIDFIANQGVNLARQKLTGADGRITLNVKSRVIETAADYLADRAPDALKFFGIDPTTSDGKITIIEMIESRLPADSDADRNGA